jgi:hypothetical protein
VLVRGEHADLELGEQLGWLRRERVVGLESISDIAASSEQQDLLATWVLVKPGCSHPTTTIKQGQGQSSNGVASLKCINEGMGKTTLTGDVVDLAVHGNPAAVGGVVAGELLPGELLLAEGLVLRRALLALAQCRRCIGRLNPR